ncbi:uncharacterized protein [Arachis hypogaea]|uniref:uncharacterized protein isoform X1 n=1 Tax=Arachis hypogaea TaxID=3818 RepID=UPI003B228C3E
MNSPSYSSAAPRRALFGLHLNDHPCKYKAVRNKMAAAGEAIDYKCLILFTNGKKTISTSIQSWFEDRLQDLPDDPNNELMIPEDPECNKEGSKPNLTYEK